MLLRRRLLLLFVAIVAGVLVLGADAVGRDPRPGPRPGAGTRALGGARTGRPPRDRVHRPGDRRTGLRAHGRGGVSRALTPAAARTARPIARRSSCGRRSTPQELQRAAPTRSWRPAATWRGTRPSARSRSATRRAASAAADAIATRHGRRRSSTGCGPASPTLGTQLQRRGRRAPPATSTTSASPCSPRCSSTIAVVAIVGAIVGGVPHPPLGHAPDRRASPDEVRRVQRGRARLADPDRPGHPSSRRWRSTSTRCGVGSASSLSIPSGPARRSSRAPRSCSRCGPSSSPMSVRFPTGGRSPATLRAAEGVVAGDCYDLFVTKTGRDRAHRRRHRRARCDRGHPGAAVQGDAPHRARPPVPTPGEALDTTADMLGDMGAEVFLTAFVAVIDTADGRVRYANAGHPPAYRRRAPTATTSSNRPVHSSACWRRDGRPPRR